MAMSNRLMKEISDQFLVCKICTDPYKDPKTLSCLHTFCADCLQQHMDAERERGSRFTIYGRYITCPLCRKKTEIPPGGVRRLPDNFLVSNLTDVIERRRTSKVPLCEICNTVRKRNRNACSKCLDCSKLLCKSCVDLHQTTKVTQHHSLFDIDGEKDKECKIHQDEMVRFYCEPCDECICIVCTFQEHRDHEICSFSEGFTKYKLTLETLLNNCKDRASDVQDRLSLITRYDSILKGTRERIRDLAISYISQVRSTEKVLLKAVDDMFGEDKLSFLQNREWLQENYDNLQSTCNLAEIVMKDKGIEMLMLKKEIQRKLSLLLEPSLPHIPENIIKKFKFIPGTVNLGTLSILNGSNEEKHFKDDIDVQGVFTQTDSINVCHNTTSMNCDMSVGIADSDCQTAHYDTSNRGTITDTVTVRNKGTYACTYDTRSRGSMTNIKEEKSIKLQTESVVTYDQGSMTYMSKSDLDSNDVSINDSLNAIMACNGTDNPNRHIIRSRKTQTPVVMTIDKSLGTSSILTNNVKIGTDHVIKCDRAVNTRMKSPLADMEVNVGTGTDDLIPIPSMLNNASVQANSVLLQTINCSTMTENPKLIDNATATTVCITHVRTQTPLITMISCDTTTETIHLVTKATSTPAKTLVNEGTNMTALSYIDDGTSTNVVHVAESCTSTLAPKVTNRATDAYNVIPDQSDAMTNTLTVMHRDQGSGSNLDNVFGILENHDQAFRAKRLHMEESAETFFPNSSCSSRGADSWRGSHADASTNMPGPYTRNQQTSTIVIPCVEQWTTTNRVQFANTGTLTTTPQTSDTGVSTMKVFIADAGTNPNAIETCDSQTGTSLRVAHSETLTDQVFHQDAQTNVDVTLSDSTTWIDFQSQCDEGTMTDNSFIDEYLLSSGLLLSSPSEASFETASVLTKSSTISLDDKFVNSIDNLDELVNEIAEADFGPRAVLVDQSTMSSPIPMQDEGTMVLSFGPISNGLMETEVQTVCPTMIDRSMETMDNDTFANTSSADMATSTDSLCYFGMLDDMDGDELFLVPQGALDIVSYYGSEGSINMIDDETLTDDIYLIEAGTQTISPPTTVNHSMVMPERDNEVIIKFDSKRVTNQGMNTVSKLTFEKETCTPSKHLFSKGTMTLYVAKTDKSTGTSIKLLNGLLGRHPLSSAIPTPKGVDKNTMTSGVETKESAVATECFIDENLAHCINKLRNVRERLELPLSRQNSSGDEVPGHSSAMKQNRELTGSPLGSPLPCEQNVTVATFESPPSTPLGDERQRNIQDLIAQTQAVLKTRDKHVETGTFRKAQPITTLRGRVPERYRDVGELKSHSLPRQFTSPEPAVHMGSHVQSRLSLLRFNSAPGRITTVPTLSKPPLHPGTKRAQSPSKIPTATQINEVAPHDFIAMTQKPKQLPSLPVISEARTSSSCSDTSVSKRHSASTSSDSENTLTRQPSTPTTPVMNPGETSPTGKKPGFMQKLLPRKKKVVEEKPFPPPKPVFSKSALKLAVEKPKEKKTPKPPKKRPFVYIRQRVFSIQHDSEDDKPSKHSKGKFKTDDKSQDPGSVITEESDSDSHADGKKHGLVDVC